MTINLYMHTYGDVAKSFLLPHAMQTKVEFVVTTDTSKPAFDTTVAYLQSKRKLCVIVGCTSSSSRKGLCFRHGGYQHCTIDKCERPIQKSKLCRVHYLQYMYCKEDGCSNRIVHDDVCRKHYMFAKCIVDGCNNQSHNKCLCVRHLKQYGTPQCIISECKQPVASALGLCKKHRRG